MENKQKLEVGKCLEWQLLDSYKANLDGMFHIEAKGWRPLEPSSAQLMW